MIFYHKPLTVLVVPFQYNPGWRYYEISFPLIVATSSDYVQA